MSSHCPKWAEKRVEVQIEAITGKKREAARNQEVLQGMDDHVRRILCAGAEIKHKKDLRERIDGQPEPDHLCGAAQPGSQFVQLEMWEPEVAEGALMQGLCVLASASQPGSDRGMPVAEDTLCSGRIQPFGERRQHHRDPAREGVFKRNKGVWRRALKVV